MMEVVVADVAGKGRLFDLLSMFWLGQDETALRSRKSLVRTRRHRVGAFMHWILELSAGHYSGDMGCVKADPGFMFLESFGKLLDGVGEGRNGASRNGGGGFFYFLGRLLNFF